MTTKITPPNQQKFSFKNWETKDSFFFNPMTISEIKRNYIKLKTQKQFRARRFSSETTKGITWTSLRNFSLYLQPVFCDW